MSFPIAYIAGQFPLRSETFVWREVCELRRRGWTVHTFGLNTLNEETPAELTELRDSTQVIYAGPRSRQWTSALAHPTTVARAATDAILPSEPTAIPNRAKLIAQAIAASRLAREIRSRGIRHIHAHFSHAPTSVAMYAARIARIPFSFTGHANDLFQRRQALRLKLQRASFVACISEWHRNLYRSILLRDDEHYPIIRCGVDTDRFVPTQRPIHTDAPPHVVTVCRLVEKKGVDLLLRAVGRLQQLKRSVRLTIAGDGPMRPMLEEMARELSLQGRVTFAGALDSEQVRHLLADADVFALPCRIDSKGDRDGIPVVLMEAMSYGLPVVSGDLPAIRELVQDGKTGLLVKADAVDPLASALASILESPVLSQELGKSAREHVVEEFSLKRNVDRIERNLSSAKSRFT